MDRRDVMKWLGIGVVPAAAASVAVGRALTRPTKQVSQPTRFSTDESDPGYKAYVGALAQGCWVNVFLDGVEQKHVSMCDIELGVIRRAVLDKKGGLFAAHEIRGTLTSKSRFQDGSATYIIMSDGADLHENQIVPDELVWGRVEIEIVPWSS